MWNLGGQVYMNKYILPILICLISSPCFAGDYICYDKDGVIVSKAYSVGKSHSQRTDCVRLDREVIKSLTKYHKYIDGKIVELSQLEKDAIIAKELKEQEDLEKASIDILNISVEQLIKVLEIKGIITSTEVIDRVKIDEGLTDITAIEVTK